MSRPGPCEPNCERRAPGCQTMACPTYAKYRRHIDAVRTARSKDREVIGYFADTHRKVTRRMN